MLDLQSSVFDEPWLSVRTPQDEQRDETIFSINIILVYIQFVLNSVQALRSKARTDCELAITTNSSIQSRFSLATQQLSLLFFY